MVSHIQTKVAAIAKKWIRTARLGGAYDLASLAFAAVQSEQIGNANERLTCVFEAPPYRGCPLRLKAGAPHATQILGIMNPP